MHLTSSRISSAMNDVLFECCDKKYTHLMSPAQTATSILLGRRGNTKYDHNVYSTIEQETLMKHTLARHVS